MSDVNHPDRRVAETETPEFRLEFDKAAGKEPLVFLLRFIDERMLVRQCAAELKSFIHEAARNEESNAVLSFLLHIQFRDRRDIKPLRRGV